MRGSLLLLFVAMGGSLQLLFVAAAVDCGAISAQPIVGLFPLAGLGRVCATKFALFGHDHDLRPFSTRGSWSGRCDDADSRIDPEKAPLRAILLATQMVWCTFCRRGRIRTCFRMCSHAAVNVLRLSLKFIPGVCGLFDTKCGFETCKLTPAGVSKLLRVFVFSAMYFQKSSLLL
jgi:hypothetical protein